MTVLIDSVIVIDHLNAVQAASEYLAANPTELCVSVITRAEVLAGLDGKARRLARALLNEFVTLDVTAAVADLAALLRRRYRWKLPDALQAALARRHHLRLATRNDRDFPPEKHRFVIVPYSLPWGRS